MISFVHLLYNGDVFLVVFWCLNSARKEQVGEGKRVKLGGVKGQSRRRREGEEVC